MASSALATIDAKLRVKITDENGNVQPISSLDNASLRPTPAKDRTWTGFTYMMFWFSATANVSNLYAASTGMALGLTMWEAIACSLGGQFLAGCLMALNGRAGAVYHIPFPVLCRPSFGIWGSLWPTFNRAAMSIVWNGVNSVQGAQCLYVCLHAIFPSIENIPNIMGSKSALTSTQMMCFFIYWLINCAFLIVPVPKMRVFVYIKVAVFFAAVIGMLAWTVSLAGTPLVSINASATVAGTKKSWLICKFVFLGLGSCGTFISNAADLQRYARHPNDTILAQLISFPLSNFLIAVFGNVIPSAANGIFGEVRLATLLEKQFLSNDGDGIYTPANRAGCALISLALVYSTVFSAIFENSISAGNDIATLLPRYITVKRGFFICALRVLSYAICPWYLLSSATVFITFLSSYQIFLCAVAGILVADYYLIRKGYLDIPALYRGDAAGPYHYFHGFNWRGFAAYCVPVALHFYGFLNQMGVAAPVSIQRLYYMAYPTGFIIAFALYSLFARFVSSSVGANHGGLLTWKVWKVWKEPKECLDGQTPETTSTGLVGAEEKVINREFGHESGNTSVNKAFDS